MRCDEVQPLQGPYLDSELDARTSLEIQQHLKSCPECTRVFSEEQNFQNWLTSGLREGQKSASLWGQIEGSVVEAARASSSQTSPRPARGSWAALVAGLAPRLRAAWSGSPRAWTGIAVAWMLILVLNLASRDNDNLPVVRQSAPSPSQMRLALKQKQSLLAELASASEPSAAGKAKPIGPSPRSQKQEINLRT